MWRDIRYAAHGLRRNPLFTLAAVLALGLAIGANATIFGLADGLWLRPPAVTRPGDLVRVFQTTETSAYGTFSFPEYTTLRDETSSFGGVIARGRRGAVMAGADGLPELLLANVVSLNFFTALGVTPEHGRVFTPDDEAALEADPGIVLGHAFWRRRFGGDPSIVGQSIDLGREGRLPVRVLGVLPESFRELDADSDRDLWMPPETWAAMSGRDEFQAQDNRWFDVVGRLGEGIGVDAAHDEVVALAAGMARDFPGTNAGRSARAVSDIGYRLETGGVNAMALLGLVLIVVLITCVNIANLLLARTAARTRELAVRVALGAGRWPLVRQLMVESGLIGALGAVCGLLVAAWLFRLVPGILVEPPGFRSFAVFEADARVVMFTVGLTLVTTFLFGIVPALVATRTDVAVVIKGESAMGGSRRLDRTFRQVLVVGQVAVSLVLLYAASVLAQSFVEARSADLGFARRPILAVWVPFGAAPQVLTSDASRQLEQLPGVTHVAVA
jgi:predicted permease